MVNASKRGYDTVNKKHMYVYLAILSMHVTFIKYLHV